MRIGIVVKATWERGMRLVARGADPMVQVLIEAFCMSGYNAVLTMV